jgi:hypothetical protein
LKRKINSTNIWVRNSTIFGNYYYLIVGSQI